MPFSPVWLWRHCKWAASVRAGQPGDTLWKCRRWPLPCIAQNVLRASHCNWLRPWHGGVGIHRWQQASGNSSTWRHSHSSYAKCGSGVAGSCAAYLPLELTATSWTMAHVSQKLESMATGASRLGCSYTCAAPTSGYGPNGSCLGGHANLCWMTFCFSGCHRFWLQMANDTIREWCKTSWEHTPSGDSVALRLKPSSWGRRLKADFVVTLRSLKRHAWKKNSYN